MKTFFRLVLFAALVVAGFWLWTFFFPSAEKVVRKQMASLAEVASFTAQASNLSRASKALAFIDFFSNDAQIIMDVPGLGTHSFSGRDEIRETGNAIFAGLPGLNTTFLDTTVRIGADKKSAEVSCTFRGRVGSDKDYGVEELHFFWKQIEGVWLITRAETVKTLK